MEVLNHLSLFTLVNINISVIYASFSFDSYIYLDSKHMSYLSDLKREQKLRSSRVTSARAQTPFLPFPFPTESQEIDIRQLESQTCKSHFELDQNEATESSDLR